MRVLFNVFAYPWSSVRWYLLGEKKKFEREFHVAQWVEEYQQGIPPYFSDSGDVLPECFLRDIRELG